jgi:AraC family transcriptional regulator, regulatory protein of adaptative response / methylated-DNA-[protein]-cysteine methyltransferase
MMSEITNNPEQSADYQLIAQAIEYIEQNVQMQPGLDELAHALSVSPGHLQRTFQRWAGISPKRFLQYLTVKHAKGQLEAARPLLDVAFASGLSGPGRLHDHFVAIEALTPGEYKRQAAGLKIAYGLHDTPFGPALVAVTPRGLNALAFVGEEGFAAEVELLARRWPGAILVEEPAQTAGWVARIFSRSSGNGTFSDDTPLRLLLKGTNFQIKVWEALLRIPEGALCTYGDIARQVCGPKAARAVGAAVGANPIAYLIPCHRVIRQSGVIHDYRWGSTRKKALAGWEAARSANAIERVEMNDN